MVDPGASEDETGAWDMGLFLLLVGGGIGLSTLLGVPEAVAMSQSYARRAFPRP